jgi:hypothetical protein
MPQHQRLDVLGDAVRPPIKIRPSKLQEDRIYQPRHNDDHVRTPQIADPAAYARFWTPQVLKALGVDVPVKPPD